MNVSDPVVVEKGNFEWMNSDSENFLKGGYIAEDKDPIERVWDIAQKAEEILNIDGFAKKFFTYMSRGWYSLASPEWANFGTDRGLSVSCFGSYVSDSIGEILESHAEVGAMVKNGGGCSGYFGDVRPRGSDIGGDNGKTSGSVHFMELFDKLIQVISQGSTRRGAFAAYLPIEHGDFDEFVKIATDGHPIQQIQHGVTVTDDFIEQMKNGDREKRRKWAKVIDSRFQAGFPYVLFIDNINNNTVDVYKDKGKKIVASNLCSEIALESNTYESFVCVLASMNILHYEEWKDTDAVKVLTYFLDAVVTEFIRKVEAFKDSDPKLYEYMQRPLNFAKRQRALGIGVLGWHSFLQSNNLPFDSKEAMKYNATIAKHIESESWSASRELAELYGEPDLLKGYGRRNTTLTATAPTKSSSFILGQVSQSIEPEMSNFYVKDLAKAKVVVKNKYLKKILKEEYDKDINEVWDSILNHDGSVQHFDWLSQHHKDVFKTFGEIDPYVILDQAAIRQQYIDQSQSLNLMIGPSATAKDVNKLYLYAHEMGIKSLYYQFSTSAAQELARNNANGCESCEA